jgi:hypothetical protein
MPQHRLGVAGEPRVVHQPAGVAGRIDCQQAQHLAVQRGPPDRRQRFLDRGAKQLVPIGHPVAGRTRTPAAMHSSTATGASFTVARVGTTATMCATSRAAAGSARIRSRMRSCTATGTTSASDLSSSVTSSALPPASR